MDVTPIPYVGYHNGPKRVLHLYTRRGLSAKASVTIGIDGAHYHQGWGKAAFEIPADRPVHVSVSQENGQVGVAATVLTPEESSELEYRGPAASRYAGAIGAPGTVKQRGCVIQLTLISLVLLLWVALIVILFSV